MTRPHPVTLLPVALVTVAGLVGACSSTGSDATPSTPDTTTSQSSAPPTTHSSDEPIDIMQIPEDTPLEPGKYSVGLLSDDGPTRAIVDVPEGYVAGGPVIHSDDGSIAFRGKVTKVDTDPCLGGKHIGAGTSVHDLAAKLLAQRHIMTSQPEPVTIGGYHGVHLTLTAPADLDRCRGGSVTILTAGGTWLQSDVPNTTFHEWILNVRGTRVVGGAMISPDAANPAELIHMVESAKFTRADQP